MSRHRRIAGQAIMALVALGLLSGARGQTVDKPMYMGKAATGEEVWYYGSRAQCGDLPRSDECWRNNPMIKYRLGSETFNTILDCREELFKEALSTRDGKIYRNVRPSSPATKRMIELACQASLKGVEEKDRAESTSLCEWTSEVSPDAVIIFTSTTETGSYSGSLLYKNQRIIKFEQAQAQGYGSILWSTGDNRRASGQIVVFRGDQVKRGYLSSQSQGPQRLLIVGLGASLWYGDNPQLREMDLVIAAAEGFWRPSAACPSL